VKVRPIESRNVDQFGRPDARGLAKRRPARHGVANAQNGCFATTGSDTKRGPYGIKVDCDQRERS